MKRPLLSFLVASLLFPAFTFAETEKEAAEREARVKSRLAEHAESKRQAARAEFVQDEGKDDAEVAVETDEKEVTVIQDFVVNSRRISDLDIVIKKLNKKIARYSKRIKRTDLDKTLNSSDNPKVLNIFGGNTANQREAIAYERVSLMEAERDILEAMKYVQTHKKDKQLKTQLNAIRTMITQLEQNLR
jgi:hypothetical protein